MHTLSPSVGLFILLHVKPTLGNLIWIVWIKAVTEDLQKFPASAIHGCCLDTDTLYMLYLESDSEYEDTATTVIQPRQNAS